MAQAISSGSQSGDHPSQKSSIGGLTPFRCRHCKQVLGYTDGARLYIGDIVLPLRLIFICSNCEATGQWRPVLRISGEEIRHES